MNPRVFKKDGLKHLDRVIQIVCRSVQVTKPLLLTFMQCAKYGIYTVIDLHAAPGGMHPHAKQIDRLADCLKDKISTGIQTIQLTRRCVSPKSRRAVIFV